MRRAFFGRQQRSTAFRDCCGRCCRFHLFRLGLAEAERSAGRNLETQSRARDVGVGLEKILKGQYWMVKKQKQKEEEQKEEEKNKKTKIGFSSVSYSSLWSLGLIFLFKV